MMQHLTLTNVEDCMAFVIFFLYIVQNVCRPILTKQNIRASSIAR